MHNHKRYLFLLLLLLFAFHLNIFSQDEVFPGFNKQIQFSKITPEYIEKHIKR